MPVKLSRFGDLDVAQCMHPLCLRQVKWPEPGLRGNQARPRLFCNDSHASRYRVERSRLLKRLSSVDSLLSALDLEASRRVELGLRRRRLVWQMLRYPPLKAAKGAPWIAALSRAKNPKAGEKSGREA